LKDLQEKLRSLGATEEAETAEPVAIEPPSRTFKKVMFGASIEEEIETTPFVQPENPEFTNPKTFVIGTKDHHGWYRQSLPYPQWPRPGQVATDEERAEHEQGVALWMESSQALSFYLRYRPVENAASQYEFGNGNLGQRLDREWAWLRGLWESRGMTVPSEQDLYDIKAGKLEQR